MNTILLTAWIACQALDVGSTALALKTGRFVEGNSLMAGKRGYVIKVSANVAMFTQRKRSKLIPIVMSASGCLAGSLNIHTMNK
jgi:hypothetical protein